MNKAIWTSIGLIFVIITLAVGVVAVFTTSWYTLMCGVSLIIVVFISDGCKKYYWLHEQKDSRPFGCPPFQAPKPKSDDEVDDDED